MKIRSINILALTGVMLVLILIVSVHAATPGFDCSKATTEVEKLICSDDRLADLDKQMADVFRTQLSVMGENEKKAMKKEQNLWLKSRQKILDASASREDKLKKLSELYEKKITELNQKSESSGKSKAATIMPSAEDTCELCRLFSDSTQRLSLLSNTKGSEDINNDGILEKYESRNTDCGGYLQDRYSDNDDKPIDAFEEIALDARNHISPFVFKGRTYLFRESESIDNKAIIFYLDHGNNIIEICKYTVSLNEKAIPSAPEYKEISDYLNTHNSERKLIDFYQKPIIDDNMVFQKTGMHSKYEGFLDFDNDGKKERIVKMRYSNSCYCYPYENLVFNYLAVLSGDGKSLAKNNLDNLLQEMQVSFNERLKYCLSTRVSFFEFKGKIYCEVDDRLNHVIKLLENGKIHDVCTFERKKVYTLANPCK